MSFIIFTILCNHYHHFTSTLKQLYNLIVFSHYSLTISNLQPQATSNLLDVPAVLPNTDCWWTLNHEPRGPLHV